MRKRPRKLLTKTTMAELRQSVDIHRIRRQRRKAEKFEPSAEEAAVTEKARKLFAAYPDGRIPWPTFGP